MIKQDIELINYVELLTSMDFIWTKETINNECIIELVEEAIYENLKKENARMFKDYFLRHIDKNTLAEKYDISEFKLLEIVYRAKAKIKSVIVNNNNGK